MSLCILIRTYTYTYTYIHMYIFIYILYIYIYIGTHNYWSIYNGVHIGAYVFPSPSLPLYLSISPLLPIPPPFRRHFVAALLLPRRSQRGLGSMMLPACPNIADTQVIFRCNEKGFREVDHSVVTCHVILSVPSQTSSAVQPTAEADIRAICDIGNSSKVPFAERRSARQAPRPLLLQVGVAKYGPGGRGAPSFAAALAPEAMTQTDDPRPPKGSKNGTPSMNPLLHWGH